MTKSMSTFAWEHELTEERPRLPDDPFARLAGPQAWELMRDRPNERDRTLSSLAIQWSAELPEAICPVRLCAQFPRIANRLALSWSDPALTQLILESLRDEKRGGRKGFPTDVAAELVRLRSEVRRRLA